MLRSAVITYFKARVIVNVSQTEHAKTKEKMADTEVAPAVAPAVAAKPKTTKKAAKPKATKKATPSAHPPYLEMVTAAINNLKERNGSSLQAIKKYIAANYKCNVEKSSSHIRKALKSGVSNGKLLQAKGTGASGSFKVNAPKPVAKSTKPKAKKVAKKAAKPKKTVKKATKSPKKVKKAKKSASAEKKPKKAGKSVAKKPAAKKAAKKPKAAKKAKKAAKK